MTVVFKKEKPVKMKKLFLLLLFLHLFTSCQSGKFSVDELQSIFDQKLRDVYHISNIDEIKRESCEIKSVLKDLKEQRNEHQSDFAYLNRLYEFKKITLTEKFDNPPLVFQYLRSKDALKNAEAIKKRYEKAAPKCFIFRPDMDNSKLEEAFSLLKNESFSHDGGVYKFSDAIEKWKKIKGHADDKAAKEAFSKHFQQGICKGLERVANHFFCKKSTIRDEELASLLEDNFVFVLKDQMIENIMSALLKIGERNFTNAYEEYMRSKYTLVLTIKGFYLKQRFKHEFRKLFKQFSRGQALAVYVGFRAGSPHAMALQISDDQFRFVDNNLGILRFANENEMLDALSDYRVNFYGEIDNPETVAFVTACGP